MDGSVGILSKFLAEAVRTSVLNVEFRQTSKDFLLAELCADCAMMLFATICSRDAFILSKTDGSVRLVF